MRRFRPDIVHTHTAKAGVLGRTAARLTGAPAVVHTFHGHLLHGYFSPAVTRMVVTTERALAHATTRLVAVGAQVRDDLLAAGIGKPEQYEIVPPGVALPPAPTRSDARRMLGLPADAVIVAFVARLTAVKRPDRFIDMAHLVLAEHPYVVFTVVGEGALLNDMRSRSASLGDQVRFLGWRSDVETVYAACDIVALTSDNEGMPVSLIEAATVGRGAVTTDVGSAREVVVDGETGFVVSADASAVAAAVCRLVTDAPLRERMASAAASRAATAFSRARLVADTARIYEDLAVVKRLPHG
jgi:glycosyltransferase involved in cell wall biosynthesis